MGPVGRGAREYGSRARSLQSAPRMPAPPQVLGLAPASCVQGEFRPAVSKSLAQRALLCASFAHGTSTLAGLGEGPAEGDDVRAARGVLAALDVRTEVASAGGLRVAGVPPGTGSGLAAEAVLALGESGTLARLTTALVALAARPGQRWTLAASGSLLFRRSRPLFAALARAGVEIRLQNLPGTWPVELVAATPPAEVTLVEPVSSQEVSGLLAALAAHTGERVLTVRGRIPSAPYLALTIGLLAGFGASVVAEPLASEDGLERRRFRVRGPLEAPSAPLALEPDASSAAVALAAACLSGGALRVPGLGPASLQGDVRIAAYLAAFGCAARADAQGLSAQGFPTRGAELDLSGEPDLAPVLAAVAAAAALRHGASSRLLGLGTLPGKESDRLSVLAEGLATLGLALEVGADSLGIGPGPAPEARPRRLDPRGDHRMAFAFALLGLVVPGVRVCDPQCVAKSWASFWSDLERLGAVLEPG